MTYELAKQLKDAGFPQGEFEGNNWERHWECQHPPGGHAVTPNCDKCYTPTLSEVIEACGEKFGHLAFWKNGNPAGSWQAVGDGETEWASTPEEAVAKLYLALNQK
jgi:hypothetical protein